MSPISRPAIGSSATGSGGTGRGSVTGVGGAGGRAFGSSAVAGGGGVGRATGGCFFAHAPIRASATITAQKTLCLCIIISAQSLLGGRRARPVGIAIRARAGKLAQPGAIAMDGEDLFLARPARHEGDVPAVRRKRRAFVVADRVGQVAGLPGRELEHA